MSSFGESALLSTPSNQRHKSLGATTKSTRGQGKKLQPVADSSKRKDAPVIQENNTCSDTMNVHGYEVKASLAPVLEAIYAKYGDIAANCPYKSTTIRAALLEVICKVVQRLQNEEFVVIASQLDSMKCEIGDVATAHFEVSWLHKYLAELSEVPEIGLRSSMMQEAKVHTASDTEAALEELKHRQNEFLEAEKRLKDARRHVAKLKSLSQTIENNLRGALDEERVWRNKLNELL